MTTDPPHGSEPEPEVWLVPPGYVPPDPDETPPLDLSTATTGVRPWATLALVLSWTIVVLVMAMRHELGDRATYLAWGASATGLPPLETAWRLLASTFLHDGMPHLFFNAISMLVYGPAVERLFGRRGFWPVFALGGAAASLASNLWRGQHDAPSVSLGASGAIFALGGALLAAALRLRSRLGVGRARALGAVLLFLLMQSLAGGVTRAGTDNVAHAAGLVSGFVMALVLPLAPRVGGPARAPAVTALAVLCGAALAVSFAIGVRSGLGF